jgi:hypothetical protein
MDAYTLQILAVAYMDQLRREASAIRGGVRADRPDQ